MKYCSDFNVEMEVARQKMVEAKISRRAKMLNEKKLLCKEFEFSFEVPKDFLAEDRNGMQW